MHYFIGNVIIGYITADRRNVKKMYCVVIKRFTNVHQILTIMANQPVFSFQETALTLAL